MVNDLVNLFTLQAREPRRDSIKLTKSAQIADKVCHLSSRILNNSLSYNNNNNGKLQQQQQLTKRPIKCLTFLLRASISQVALCAI